MTSKKNCFTSLWIIIPMLLTLVYILSVREGWGGVMASAYAVPMPIHFAGEYSYDGENWQTLTDDSDISALKGDLLLRGHFSDDIPDGGILNYYRDHIMVSACVNGADEYTDDVTEVVNYKKKLVAVVCQREWGVLYMTDIAATDSVELCLHNPHTYGNSRAYREFLDTMCVVPAGSDILEKSLESRCDFLRGVAMVLMTGAFILMGASVPIFVSRMPDGPLYLKLGLLTFFIGCYSYADVMDSSLVSDSLFFAGAYDFMMVLAVLCMSFLLCETLTGQRGKIVRRLAVVSTIVASGIMLASVMGVMCFDLLQYWNAFYLVVCCIEIVCCIQEIRMIGIKGWTFPVSCLLFLVANVLDEFHVGASIYSHYTCSKIVYVILFALHICIAAKFFLEGQRSKLRIKKLETELEDSRIAIMLSQIQPHFVYNVLNSIYHLYESNPQKAQDAVSKFADYLRSNMQSIEKTELIHFNEEYAHIQTYLSLEQIRFSEELKVEYDIQTTAFRLPALTVQPLVENAVKYGITKRTGGGTVTISTRETEENYEVIIEDDGVGFNTDSYMEDGKTHIGIRNVRRRLQSMVGGTLTISSTPGKGTCAVVCIPKE